MERGKGGGVARITRGSLKPFSERRGFFKKESSTGQEEKRDWRGRRVKKRGAGFPTRKKRIAIQRIKNVTAVPFMVRGEQCESAGKKGLARIASETRARTFVKRGGRKSD